MVAPPLAFPVVKVAAVMLVRNEADILGVNLAHLFAQGVDEIRVLDNGSTDATPRVLRRFAQRANVVWTTDDGPFTQPQKTTALAHEAIRDGADWVFAVDADEFWVATGQRSLREVLAGSTAGALSVQVVNFVQDRRRSRRGRRSLLSMTHRVAEATVGGDEARLRVAAGDIAFVEIRYTDKWICRAAPDLAIGRGNHTVSGVVGDRVPTDEIACFHAPLRARAVLAGNKVQHAARLAQIRSGEGEGWHLTRWAALAEAGTLDREWAANSHVGGRLDVFGSPRDLVPDDRLRATVRPWLWRR